MSDFIVPPKHIVVRCKDIHGHMKQLHFEDIIYFEVLDMSRQQTDKCVFLVNINK